MDLNQQSTSGLKTGTSMVPGASTTHFSIILACSYRHIIDYGHTLTFGYFTFTLKTSGELCCQSQTFQYGAQKTSMFRM